MPGYQKTIVLLFSIFFMVIACSCGIKGAPKPPLRIGFVKVMNLSGKIVQERVVLSWTPSFNYDDSSELLLRSVEIYKLKEDLSERLIDQAERAEKRREATINAGLDPVQQINESAIGSLNLKIQKMSFLPAENFERKARLLASIPIEQMIEMAAGGKINWQEQADTPSVDSPNTRAVYAIKEVDIFGAKSTFSNLVNVYPITAPPGPTEVIPGLTQQKLILFWNSPEQVRVENLEFAMVGHNVYKAAEEADFTAAPVNAELIKTAAPLEWNVKNILAHQRLVDENYQNSYLFTTDAAAGEAGIWQTIYNSSEVATKIGQDLEIEITIKSVGSNSNGRIIFDSHKNPDQTEEQQEPSIFSEEENPLIQIEDVLITNDYQTIKLTGKVPVGAVAYVLRIEPRGKYPVAASFIIKSVLVREVGTERNLINNGDFDGFNPVNYAEDITVFGQTVRFKVTSVYSVSGQIVESAASAVKSVQIVDTFPPDAPTGVRAQASVDSITLTWNASAATDIRGYVIYRRQGREVSWKRITQQPFQQTVYRDREAQAETKYEYKVEALDREGNLSSTATVISAQLLPGSFK